MGEKKRGERGEERRERTEGRKGQDKGGREEETTNLRLDLVNNTDMMLLAVMGTKSCLTVRKRGRVSRG